MFGSLILAWCVCGISCSPLVRFSGRNATLVLSSVLANTHDDQQWAASVGVESFLLRCLSSNLIVHFDVRLVSPHHIMNPPVFRHRLVLHVPGGCSGLFWRPLIDHPLDMGPESIYAGEFYLIHHPSSARHHHLFPFFPPVLPQRAIVPPRIVSLA